MAFDVCLDFVHLLKKKTLNENCSHARRYRIFIIWVLILHWHPNKAQRQTEKLRDSSFQASSLHSLAHSFEPKYPHGGEDDLHFQDRIWWSQTLPHLPFAHGHSSLLSSVWLPAVSPLQWVAPTTRWRTVFCSGNSVCRTHCWLSAVLGLFQLSLGASGPTAGVFCRPLKPGRGSGSYDDRRKSKYVGTKRLSDQGT